MTSRQSSSRHAKHHRIQWTHSTAMAASTGAPNALHANPLNICTCIPGATSRHAHCVQLGVGASNRTHTSDDDAPLVSLQPARHCAWRLKNYRMLCCATHCCTKLAPQCVPAGEPQAKALLGSACAAGRGPIGPDAPCRCRASAAPFHAGASLGTLRLLRSRWPARVLAPPHTTTLRLCACALLSNAATVQRLHPAHVDCAALQQLQMSAAGHSTPCRWCWLW